MSRVKLDQNRLQGLLNKLVRIGAGKLLSEERLPTIGLGDIAKRAITILVEKYGFKELETVACEIEGPRGYITYDMKQAKPEEFGYLESILPKELLERICLYNDETLRITESRRGLRKYK